MNLHPKVAASTLAGALSLLLVWILSHWVQIPVEVGEAFTVILSFLVGYLTPSPKAVP